MKKYLVTSILLLLSAITANAQVEFWGIANIDNTSATLYSIEDNTGNVVEKLNFENDYYSYGINLPSSSEFCMADNGKLYFTMNDGGDNDNGGIVELDPITNRVLPVYYFDKTVGYNGSPTKQTLIKASNGKLYGTIRGVDLTGKETKSIIYEFDPDTKKFTIKYTFDQDFKTNGKLVQASNGFFYGTAYKSGDVNYDMIYQFDLNTNTLSIKHKFIWGDDEKDGNSPCEYLIEGGTNILYGLTFSGGEPDQSRNRRGTLFSYNAGNDTFATLVSFSDQDNVGRDPRGSLVKTTDGNLYGLVSSSKSERYNTIFKYNPSTKDLTVAGAAPRDYSQNAASHTLMLANNGKLMGITQTGVIYSFDTATNTTKIEVETERTNNVILTEVNDEFYALVDNDKKDSGDVKNKGAIIKFSNNSFENIFSFGHTDAKCIPSNHTSLVKGPNGHLYGLAEGGVTSFFASGVIFEFDPETNYYQNIHVFYSDEDGSNPEGTLFLAKNNRFYGYTSNGMFEYDLSNNKYEQVADFGKHEIANTNIPIQASNGKIYGMVKGASYGDEKPSIFEYNITSKEYKIIFDFGTLPLNIVSVVGSLIEYNGYFYGLISNGSSGYLFKYNMATSEIEMKVNFYKSTKTETGQYPVAMLKTSNNKMYGVTVRGGAFDSGTVFEYDLSTDTFTKKLDFNTPEGRYPQSSLMQASNGKLYGRAKAGENDRTQILYEYDITSNTYSKKIEYSINTNIGNLLDYNKTNSLKTPTYNISENYINIYPNPASNTINIKYDSNISKIEIFNQQGQLILMNRNNKSINISELQLGIYLVRVSNDEGVIGTQKIIKK